MTNIINKKLQKSYFVFKTIDIKKLHLYQAFTENCLDIKKFPNDYRKGVVLAEKTRMKSLHLARTQCTWFLSLNRIFERP